MAPTGKNSRKSVLFDYANGRFIQSGQAENENGQFMVPFQTAFPNLYAAHCLLVFRATENLPFSTQPTDDLTQIHENTETHGEFKGIFELTYNMTHMLIYK